MRGSSPELISVVDEMTRNEDRDWIGGTSLTRIREDVTEGAKGSGRGGVRSGARGNVRG